MSDRPLFSDDIETQLAAMAADLDIQREIEQIALEFSVTELDGLVSEQQ